MTVNGRAYTVITSGAIDPGRRGYQLHSDTARLIMKLGSFSAAVGKFNKKANESMDRTVRKTVIGLGTAIVKRNPVGTPATTGVKGYRGGRSKANWQYGLNSIPTSVIEDFDPDGNRTIAGIAASVPRQAGGHVHYIANNVEYIGFLENGSSKQAPHGMVVRTILDFQQIVKSAAK